MRKVTALVFLIILISCTETYPGKILGDINNLDIVGVVHEAEGSDYFLFQKEIENIFSIQEEKRILILEGPGKKSMFGKVFKKTSPQGWITKSILKSHDTYVVYDVRPRDGSYLNSIESLFELMRSLEKDGFLTFSLSDEKKLLPVYDLDLSTDFQLEDYQINMLRQEKSFNETLVAKAKTRSAHRKMKYLSFVGAAHAYAVWFAKPELNVYLGLNEDQLDEVARLYAFQHFCEKKFL